MKPEPRSRGAAAASTDIYAEDYGSDGEESLGGSSGGGGSMETKAKGNGKDQPLFLRKTYELLESCPQHIASWSDRGDSIIIYDPEAFSQQVIPQHFAHSNFSSFVRQLNFYGFRKVKLDSKPQSVASTNKWWEFRHDKFQRGKQHLLSHIRRATHGANNDQEVSVLKSEVGQLKDKLQEMSNNIDKLTSLVNDLMLDKMSRTSVKEESPRRRKMSRRSSSTMYNNEGEEIMVKAENEEDYFPSTTHEANTEDRYPPWFGSGMASSSAVSEGVSFSDILPMETTEAGGASTGGGYHTTSSFTHQTGFDGVTGHRLEEEDLPSLGSDPDIETFLQSLEEEEENKKQTSTSGRSSSHDSSSRCSMIPVKEEEQVSALEQNLQSLTPDLQKKLVETLVAMGAGKEASSSSSGNRTPPAPIALPLASAALGAFLTQYARSQRARETAKPSGAANQPSTRKEVESQAC